MLPEKYLLYAAGVVALLTAAYWAGPILHWRNSRNRPKTNPKFWLATESLPVPAESRKHFDAVAAKLAPLGFNPLPAISAAQGPITMNLQFFVHDQLPERVTAAVIHAEGAGGFHLEGLGVSTIHSDGRDWETSTSATARTLHPKSQRILRAPGVSEPLALLHLHRHFVKDQTKSPAIRRPVSDPLAIQADVEKRVQQKMVKSGWYSLQEGGCVPTIKGACLGIWINLPPWKNILDGRDDRRRRRYQKMPATRPSAARGAPLPARPSLGAQPS